MTITADAVTLKADEIELTEFEAINVEKISGVGMGANGFPHLLVKGVAEPDAVKGARDCPKCSKNYDADHAGEKCENCGTMLPDAPADTAKSLPEWLAELTKAIVRGKVDETQDLDLAKQIIALLTKAISLEADELAAGNLGEITDIRMLSDAVSMIKCWQAREQAVADGQDPDAAGMLMCSVAVPAEWTGEAVAKVIGVFADGNIELPVTIQLDGKQVARTVQSGTLAYVKSSAEINDLPDSAFAHIEDGGSKDDGGKTTPRSLRHFPVHDEKHARLAVQQLSASKFGDKAKPRVMAAAKKFGIDTTASKAAVAESDPAVDTVTQSEDTLAKSDLADAVSKALTPHGDRLKAVEEQMAKVLALPQPGGPVLTVTRPPKQAGPDAEDWAAKAAGYRAKAELVSDAGTADGYRQLAREADDKAAALK